MYTNTNAKVIQYNMSNSLFDINLSALGKKSDYVSQYKPCLLFPIPRQLRREELFKGRKPLCFYGIDIWNAYEVYWLDLRGKPQVRIAEIIYDAKSEFMVESKSLKLYLNSFNNTTFNSVDAVRETIIKDLSAVLKTEVACTLYGVEDNHYLPQKMKGICLDDLDIEIKAGEWQKIYLDEDSGIIQESLYTNLLKSNCLITKQPDFGSLFINYTGVKINHKSILQYVVQLRNLNEFHEQCVENIFCEIYYSCKPLKLEISARYTRRGGIDINPVRASTKEFQRSNDRKFRQ